jgi:hypothetical protein
MKLRTLLAACCLLLILPAGAAHAQQPTHIVYAHAGAALPLAPSEFSDYRSPALVTGLWFGFPKSERLQMVFGFDHAKHGLDESAVADATGLLPADVRDAGGTVSWWTITLGLRANARRPIFGGGVPYVHGNLAFVRMSSDILSPTLEQADFYPPDYRIGQNAPGLLVGAGLEFNVGKRVNLYVEGRLATGVTGDRSLFAPLVVGLSVR